MMLIIFYTTDEDGNVIDMGTDSGIEMEHLQG